jgi:hypothetical protein
MIIDIFTNKKTRHFEGSFVWSGYESDGFVAFRIEEPVLKQIHLIPIKEIKQICITEDKNDSNKG